MAAVKQRQIEDDMENGNPSDAWKESEQQQNNTTCGEAYYNHAAEESDEHANIPTPTHIFPKNAMDANDTMFITGEELDSKKGWGSAPIFKITETDGSERMIAVPQDIDYAFRGEALRSLSLVEYPCIIEVIVKPGKSRSRNKEFPLGQDDDGLSEEHDTDIAKKHKTKVTNTCLPFQRFHPLADTHTQRIRSKLLIPCLGGEPPPTMQAFDAPGARFNTMSQRNQERVSEAARYYMTLLCPWTIQDESSDIRERGDLMPTDGTTYGDFVMNPL